MIRSAVILLILISSLPSLLSQVPQQASAELKDSHWNFGEKEQGEADEKRFEIKNLGKAPLLIQFAKVTCGCLEAKVETKEIAPGEIGTVLVHLDSSRQQGEIKKQVYIGTNDPRHPHLAIEVSGIIHARIKLEPSQLQLGLVKPEEEKIFIQEVLIREGKDIKLIGVDFALPNMLSVETEAFGELKGRHGYRLSYRALDGLPRGQRIQIPIQLRFDDKEMPKLTTSVGVETLGVLVLEPDILDFGKVTVGEAASFEAILRHRENRDFKILSLRALDPKIQVSFDKDKAGSKHKIKIERQGGDRMQGQIQSRLYVVTDVQAQPMIQVPIRGQLVAAPKKN